jgi:hypothetical protein
MSETVLSGNTQDFSDNEILDNFGEGPDDGLPMGLGGEKGKQAEPASSTLEADIVNGTSTTATKTPPGETLPPDNSADSEPEPAPLAKGESGKQPQVPDEPAVPEFPPALLQMAGYATPEQAQQAGFRDPEALFAAVQWRGQLLNPQATPATAGGSLYRQPPPQTQPKQPQTEAATDPNGFKPFQPKNSETLDEDLLDLIRQQNEHFADQFRQQQERFASVVQARDDRTQEQQQIDEESQFDQAIQGLGETWQDVFGKGNGRELASAGQRDPAAMTAFNHRAMVFAAVEAVREANAKQGFKPMALEQEVQWALMQRYPDKFQQVLRLETVNKAKNRRGVQTSRPTARKAPFSSKNDKLLAAVDAKLRAKHGSGLDMGSDGEFEGEI